MFSSLNEIRLNGYNNRDENGLYPTFMSDDKDEISALGKELNLNHYFNIIGLFNYLFIDNKLTS